MLLDNATFLQASWLLLFLRMALHVFVLRLVMSFWMYHASSISQQREGKRSGIDVLYRNKKLQEILCHAIVDAIRDRKWNAPGISFIALRYSSLQSRHVTKTDEQNRGKDMQVEREKPQFLACLFENEVIFNCRMCFDLKELSIMGGCGFPVNRPVLFLGGHLSKSWREPVVSTVREYLRFLPHLETKSGAEPILVRTDVVLGRLHAYLATPWTRFSENSSNKAGGHRQKLYHDTCALRFWRHVINCLAARKS